MTIILNMQNTIPSIYLGVTPYQSLFHLFRTTTSFVFICCVLMISLCMYAAGCRNLIYKVLNLAILSVLVVALWSYSTDMTFIYVIYVLTFVSAVVMLFLSVVLMLPSSAVEVTKRSSVHFLALLYFDTLFSAAINICFIVIVIVIAYIMLAIYKTKAVRKTYSIHGRPENKVKMVYPDKLHIAPRSIKDLERWIGLNDHYDLFTFSDPKVNRMAIKECQRNLMDGRWHYPEKLTANTNPVDNYNNGDRMARVGYYHEVEKFAVGISNYSGAFPVYINVMPRFLGYSSQWRLLLTILHEFLHFYFKMLEPRELLDYRPYKALTRLARRFVGLNIPGETPGRLPAFWTDPCGWHSQCVFYLDGDKAKEVRMLLDRPWWSPFQVFRNDEDLTFLGTVFEGLVDVIDLHIAPMFRRLKAFVQCVVLPIYSYRQWVSGRFHVASVAMSTSYAEIATQLYSTVSIFMLASPIGNPGAFNLVDYSVNGCTNYVADSLENMAALQNELYVVSPLFMLVSVTGLLVALVGAPLFVSAGSTSYRAARPE